MKKPFEKLKREICALLAKAPPGVETSVELVMTKLGLPRRFVEQTYFNPPKGWKLGRSKVDGEWFYFVVEKPS